jgi:MoxR-like ATPase
MVLATQNHIEYEGTFPLPEAQLDRFLMRLHLGYPSVQDEVTIMDRQVERHPIETLEAVCGPQDILALQEAVKGVWVDPLVKLYIAQLVDATRKHEAVYLGASPRGSLALQRACQAKALVEGRDFVLPDDVKELAYPVLGHRIIVSPASRVRGVTSQQVVEECLGRLVVPGVRARRP